MENLNNGESSSSNQNIRSRIELLPKLQLVDLLCNLASQHPSIAQEIETLTNVHDVTPRRTLFVRSLSPETSSQTLLQAFEEFGEIEDAFVVRDRVTRKSKNYGYVTYRDVESVNAALREPRKTIDGSMTICCVADERFSAIDFSLLRKLYIGDLAEGVTTENLRSDFQIHGEILEAVVVTNGGYGFVRFATAEAAKKAIDHNTLNPTIVDGRKRIVKYANPWTDRRGSRRNPSPEYGQSEDDYVDSHSPVSYAPPPYETYGVSYPPPLYETYGVSVSYPPPLYETYGVSVSYHPPPYAMTDRFGNQYYYDYSYPY